MIPRRSSSTWRLALRFTLVGFGLFVAGSSGTAAAASPPTTVTSSPLDSLATLLWTAPGDDGMVGRANHYEMRYRNVGISGTDTTSWWAAATAVGGMPTPGLAGSTDSVTVRNLDPRATWYFVLRTADEVPNWSGFSNVVVRAPVVDTTPPAAITNLTASAPSLVAIPGETAAPAAARGVSNRR